MLSHFYDILRIDLQLNPKKPLVIGVSGGPDSLFLLDIMIRHGFSVVVAHLDHGLRAESGGEARRVGLIAESFGVPFILEARDVAVMADTQGLSLEEAARIARYRFLFQQAQILGAQAVAVGHNANDQVETVLMHLLRGAGLSGLKGMTAYSLPNPWSDKIPLVRPLLSVWRAEILEHCQQRGLEPVFDSSNQDTDFFRNRLRHDLIPYLDEYVPGMRERLWRMADILADDNAVLEEAAFAAKNICLESQATGFVSFNARVFTYQPVAVQRRLIRWAVSELRQDTRDLGSNAVERALLPLASPLETIYQDVALGLRAFIEDGLLFIAAWEADLPSAQWPQLETDTVLQIPGEIDFPDGWQLRGEYIQDLQSVREQAYENADPFRAWFDAGDQLSALAVRARQPGDRFRPLGMGGDSTKLSDFMINQKIPRRARQRWPLVCMGDEIVWVPGFRQSHGFRLSQESKRILFLQLTPN